MTVNHDVAGSSPAGGVKQKTTQKGGLLFYSFLSRFRLAIPVIHSPEHSEETVACLLANRQTKERSEFVFIIDVAGSAPRPSPSCVVLIILMSRIYQAY